jgi:hypothetical protein
LQKYIQMKPLSFRSMFAFLVASISWLIALSTLPSRSWSRTSYFHP